MTAYHNPAEDRACRALWRAVILQAMQDAIGELSSSRASPGTRRMMKGDARDWLVEPSYGFSVVCMLAGLNPQYVKENVRNVIRRARLKRLLKRVAASSCLVRSPTRKRA